MKRYPMIFVSLLYIKRLTNRESPKMKKVIGLGLIAVLLTSCATDKGTAMDYVALLDSMKCSSEFNLSTFSSVTLSTKKSLFVGDDDQCIESQQGKSFYKVVKADQPFTRVYIRSFFSLRKNKANMFMPIASAVDANNGKVIEGIVDEISDDNSLSDGYFLITNYSFSTPVTSVVIHTDPRNYSYSYQMVSSGTVTLSAGSTYIPMNVSSSRNLTYNAGGAIELVLLR